MQRKLYGTIFEKNTLKKHQIVYNSISERMGVCTLFVIMEVFDDRIL